MARGLWGIWGAETIALNPSGQTPVYSTIYTPLYRCALPRIVEEFHHGTDEGIHQVYKTQSPAELVQAAPSHTAVLGSTGRSNPTPLHLASGKQAMSTQLEF